MKKISTFILILLLTTPLFSAKISFSGGYTKLSMKEGLESIILKDNAFVKVDNFELKADEITLSGSDYNIIECNGKVSFFDSENELKLISKSIYYNRENQLIVINGGVEIDDLKNQIHATSSYLEYDVDEGLMNMMVEVNLLHISDNSIMKCTSDVLKYDRTSNYLILFGSSIIKWKEDIYKAQAISVNLNNNDISMEGSIEGTIKNTN